MQLKLDHDTLLIGVVRAAPIFVGLTPDDLDTQMRAAEAIVRDAGGFDAATRGAVRDVLRVGGYKPTGRGKPASEYLLRTAMEGQLPRVNNVVDCNNLASLESALPISILDADIVGDEPFVRFGRQKEAYVFNSAGHEMDLTGIPVVCRSDDTPVGNAVKDGMTAKVHDGTTRVVAIVYGSTALLPVVEGATLRLAELLSAFAGASETSIELVSP